VETCYCGTSREQAERAARAAAPDASTSRVPWIPLVFVAVALGVLVLSLRRQAVPPAPAPEPTAATQATPRPPPPLRGRPPLAGVTAARRPTPVPPAPDPGAAATTVEAAPAAAEPAPEPSPQGQEPDDALEARRRESRAAFEARLGQLASRRDALGERLRAWDASCGSASSAVRPAGCVLLQEDIDELVAEVDAGLRESEQQARRDWVQPGERRALLESFELDPRTWGELRRRAGAALR
jgi:hypothetical protein